MQSFPGVGVLIPATSADHAGATRVALKRAPLVGEHGSAGTADGMMRHDDETNGHHLVPDRGVRGDDDTDTTIETARRELAAAAADLEQLTGELHERTALVERLEALADALLDLLAVPAVVVDLQGRVTAVSRGAAAVRASLGEGLGKPASTVVGQSLADEIAAFVAGETATPGQAEALADSDARFTALPGGSTLVVFEP